MTSATQNLFFWELIVMKRKYIEKEDRISHTQEVVIELEDELIHDSQHAQLSEYWLQAW